MSMKEMFTMMEELMGNHEEHHEEEDVINLDECKNEGKGYMTIIPDEVYDKVTDLRKAYDDLRETMGNSVTQQMVLIDKVPNDQKDYALLELALFSEMLNEAWDKISDLVAIHELMDKESIDRQCTENGLTPKQVLRMKMMNDMMELMSKMYR